ncbi:MAG: terminase small subunit [Planctomycetes bacterium]|nr:terminase small subunit [Planctomycetota bacterium]
MSDLTVKQEAFVRNYFENGGNASEAYRHAYDAENMSDKTIWEAASRLLADSKVSARVKELKERHLKRHDVTIDRVLQEFARLAYLDVRKVFDEEGNLKAIHELDDDTAAAITSLEVEQTYQPSEVDEELEGQSHGGALKRRRGTAAGARLHKIKLSDKKGALDSLAKYLGMFSDGAVTVNVNSPLAEQDKELLDEYAGKTD